MAAMILILKNVLFLSLLFLDWLWQLGLLSVQFLTLLGCLDLLSHSVLKALASSEQDKEWGQAKLTPSGTPKVQRPLSLFWCLHFWPDRQRAHRQVPVSAQRQLPFAPRGDHGNWRGLLAGVHPHKNTFLIDGGSDGPWLHTDGFQAGTGILGGTAVLHPAPVTNDSQHLQRTYMSQSLYNKHFEHGLAHLFFTAMLRGRCH